MTAHAGIWSVWGVWIAGALVTLCAVVLIAGWMRARSRRAARRSALDARSEGAPGEAPRERRGRSRFLLPALLLVLFNAITVVFFAWSPVFRVLGWSGIGAVVIFATPILVGLAYQWRMRALEW